MNLNVESWELFRLDEIFEVKKGKRLTSEDQTEGRTPYIGAIDSNNGIANYIGQAPIHQGNTISLSYNGSVGEAFYQPVPFWATDDVNVLYFRKENGVPFNEYIALFICAILRKEQYRYSYGRKWVLEGMRSTIIKLPVKNSKPDFAFMENYMKSLHHKPITTKRVVSSNQVLHPEEWKDFLLHRVLDVKMGNGIDEGITSSNNPQYAYVTRTASNNGVSGYVDYMEGEELFPSGSISLALGGSIGSCFIQHSPFYTGQNVAVLLEKVPLSTLTKLFVVSVIQNECRLKFYPFGRELNAHFRKDFWIKLPVKSDENGLLLDPACQFSDEGYIPDWEWMENYMKSLPYSDRI